MVSAGRGRKVLIIVEDQPVPFDRRVLQEARALRDAGYQVSVICPKRRPFTKGFEVIEGIHVYRYWLPCEARGAAGYIFEYLSAFWGQTILAWKVLFTRGFDAIHACNPPDTIFLVSWVFKLLGKRFVFDQHDLCPELYEAKFGRRGVLYRMVRLCEWLTYSMADVVIAPNDSYKKVAIQRGRIDPGKTFVVRSGPDLALFRPVPANPDLKKGREHLVAYLGTMGSQDGVDYLLRAAHRMVTELGRCDAQFIVIGGGPALEDLKALSCQLGIQEYVTFTGRIPDSEMLETLSTADVCVGPDVANEMNDKSTMNKTLQYMAMGKPIVQFDLTEGRFSAQDASLYARKNDPVDLAAKIVQLLDDPALRQRMGESGRRRIEEVLQWKFQVPNLLAAYDSLWGNDAA